MNPMTNFKMADKMAAVHGKVTAFVGLTQEKYIAQAIRLMTTKRLNDV